MRVLFKIVLCLFIMFSLQPKANAEELNSPEIVEIIKDVKAGGITLSTAIGDIDAHLASFKPALTCNKTHTQPRARSWDKTAPKDIYDWRCMSEIGADGSYVKLDITTNGDNINFINYIDNQVTTQKVNPAFDYIISIKDRALATGLPMNAPQTATFLFTDDTTENPSINIMRRQDLSLVGYLPNEGRTATFSLKSGTSYMENYGAEIRHGHEVILQRN